MKIIVNPNADTDAIRKAIAKNGGYCPCAIRKTEDTKCRCKEFREQIEPGPCHCGLYVKEEEE